MATNEPEAVTCIGVWLPDGGGPTAVNWKVPSIWLLLTAVILRVPDVERRTPDALGVASETLARKSCAVGSGFGSGSV